MATHTVVNLTDRRGLEDLRGDWEELFHASGTTNPFLHPGWQLAWCDSFIEAKQIMVLAVRHRGALIGVAPFYRRHFGWRGNARSSHLRAFGAGRNGQLTEVPGILVHPKWTRSVMRDLFGHLLADESWDWIDVPLGHHQGWFEPEWAQGSRSGRPGTVSHKGTRPCVVLPLSDDWEATLAGLKRNVRQSVHRGRNRLSRTGRHWELEVADPERFGDFVRTLAVLHAARAAIPGRVRHPDLLADPRQRAFVELAGAGMAHGEHLYPCILRVDGRAVAARLVLRAGDTLYFSLSGFDPGHWDDGVATTLVAECLAYGVKQGVTAANFGTGVDVSKLRWSESLERNEEFMVVAPRRRSQLAFRMYWQLRTDRLRF